MVTSKMKKILADFVPVLQEWTTSGESKLIDGFETDYDENYAPAVASVIYASVYTNERDPKCLENMHTMIRRTVKLLQDREGVSPFCRVFLEHYSLLGMLMLPEDARDEFIQEYGAFYREYEDDCEQVNTNCAALQWGTGIFLDALGFRDAHAADMNRLLDFIEQSQHKSGFINDDVTLTRQGDGMPIAYHAFSVFILTSVLAIIEDWNDAHTVQKNRVEAIIRMGRAWLKHTISVDGMFAMIGRSGYQMFNWGTFVTFLSGFDVKQDEVLHDLLNRALEYWLPYKQSDGTYGCVPNHLAHGMRVGFESYTHVNMYNTLGLAGIAVAERILSRDFKFDIDYGFSSQGNFLDEESGYAFYRQNDRFFACTLRTHSQGYSLAMQGFHFRVKDVRLPLAEPKLNPQASSGGTDHVLQGMWEGFLLQDAAGEIYVPDSRSNVSAVFVEHGIALTWEDDHSFGEKTIRILDRKIAWQYRLTPKQAIVSCQHVVPLIITDGKEETRFHKEKPHRIRMDFGGEAFLLQSAEAEESNISKNRSFGSVSGVGSLAHFVIRHQVAANEAIEWTTELVF